VVGGGYPKKYFSPEPKVRFSGRVRSTVIGTNLVHTPVKYTRKISHTHPRYPDLRSVTAQAEPPSRRRGVRKSPWRPACRSEVGPIYLKRLDLSSII
jgi:hypothetical protein